jgi:hypothetical protein
VKLFRNAAGVRRRSRSLTITAGMALGLSFSAIALPASAVELDSDGYARILIEGTPGAEQLWIEVEDPALSAGNTAITVDGQPVTTVDTALGVAAVVTPATKDNHVTIGVSVAADPDIAFTAVNAAGMALYTEHYRTGMTAARPQSSQSPAPTPTPAVTATVAPASSTVVPASSGTPEAVTPQGELADTGAMLGILIPVGLAVLALGLGLVLAARKKAQA